MSFIQFGYVFVINLEKPDCWCDLNNCDMIQDNSPLYDIFSGSCPLVDCDFAAWSIQRTISPTSFQILIEDLFLKVVVISAFIYKISTNAYIMFKAKKL